MEIPWRDGNRFTLIPGGKRYIPAMLAAIDGAKEFVLFEQYLIESGRLADMFVDALVRAARRGVEVFVLLDSYGAKGFKQHDRERLTEAGIALCFFNPRTWRRLALNLTRDHRKLLLVDRRVGFTGGFCTTDDFLDKWYDVAVRIEGPVIEDWLKLFSQLWVSSLAESPSRDIPPLGPSLDTSPHTGGSGQLGRVIWGRGRSQQGIRLSLQQRISTARQRVWLYTPYFLPTMSLRQRLVTAARRGADVRLLVAGERHDHPSVRYAGKSYYGQLLRAGVRIFEYQPSFTHAKFCLADDWCTIGSCNFDHWSLRWNLEANQEVEDTAFAADVVELFEDNLAFSKEIYLQDWARRPLWQRGLRSILGTMSAWFTLLR